MTAVSQILIVDDFEPLRTLVRSILSSRAGWRVVGEAADGFEAIEQAHRLQPDLMLLDIALPIKNGIQVAAEIRSATPRCKIIFVSQETSADVVQETIRVGASGFVNKARVAQDLIAAIGAVLAGKTFFADGFLSALHLQGLPTER